MKTSVLTRHFHNSGNFTNSFRPGKGTFENAAAFAYHVYEGFQSKEQALAVAIDLEDACNRFQFKLLMDLLVQ